MINHAQFWGGAAAPYEIEQSLRFNSADSAYLNRTPGSAGNRKTWTWSLWLKRAGLGATNMIWSCGGSNSAADTDYLEAAFNSSDQLIVATLNGQRLVSTQRFRDASAWYHLVFKLDTTQSTVSDRLVVYLNGSEITAWDTDTRSTYFAQNSDQGVGRTEPHLIGRQSYSGSDHTNIYLAEVNFIDGSALDHEDFGELDDNGVWRPIEYTGSYGTNGFYLDFSNSSSLGEDQAGSNDWTPNNFTTSGTGTDVMSDTPTTNYCTWNPLTIRNGSGTMSLTEGNLKFGSTASTTYGSILATIAPTSGKYYCELTFEGTKSSNYNRELFGIVPIANWQTNTRVDVHQIPGSLVYESNGTSSLAHQGTGGVANTQSYGVAWDENSNIGIAIDFDTPSLTFYVDGSSQGTFPYSMTAGEAYAIFAVDWSNFVEISAFILNAGQRAFAYTPPTGFKALNTSNLPAPTVKDGSDYFNTVLYTGDGTSSRAITGMGFQADFLWLKPRSARNHSLVDVLRGTNHLQSNNTNAEASVPSFDSFDSDGFTVTADGSTNPNWNESPEPNVVWGWLAGGSGSSNTDGSITSTVSANQTAGFSIVSYTGTGSAATVGHGLGVKPSLLIVRRRPTASNWTVYHSSVGATKRLILDLNYAPQTGSGWWNNTEPTSTVFTIGNDGGTNSTTNNTYIAYCFAEVENYSKFSSYTGNGSSDGPFVYTGHRSRWLMIKAATGITGNWVIFDTERDTDNPAITQLWSNLSSAESALSGQPVDILSNGFKIRTNDSAMNFNSSCTYIFVSFAENPFGGSGVSPATAR